MLEQLLPYYERELAELRHLGAEFAQRYPKIGRRLQIEPDQCLDPHVERLVEAFAFMAARIHHRLDEDYTEISEAFLQAMYPHYLRPIPSISILQFQPDAETVGKVHTLPRGQKVLSPAVNGIACEFRTCYEASVVPLQLQQVRLELAQHSEYLRRTTSAAAVLSLSFKTHGDMRLETLPLDRLTFFLDGEPTLTSLLYELFTTQLLNIRISDGSGKAIHSVQLPKEALRPMGFLPEESLLGCEARTLAGHRLLSEYFAFPEKFLFFTLEGLDAPALKHPGNTLVVECLLAQYGDSERHNRLMQVLSPHYFKLGCTPIVNLFERASSPITVNHRQTAYPVLPDPLQQAAYEVFSIDDVYFSESKDQKRRTRTVHPFYAITHVETEDVSNLYWHASRRPAMRKSYQGTDVEITLVDMDFHSLRPETEVLSMDLTCTNRDLPAHIPFGPQAAPFSLAGKESSKSRLLRKPTSSLRSDGRQGYQWRLISHLAAGHQPFTQGRETMQRMLQLYDLTSSTATARQIQGISDIQSAPGIARMAGKAFPAFVRGLEVNITFDESFYVGANLFLFANILERFLGHCCPVNSFVRLHMFSKQREGEVTQWPPRVSDTPLI